MRPSLYRVPKDPGYLGRFSFGPVILGFFGLLLSNVIATQYIAQHFEYQDALGTPFVRSAPLAFTSLLLGFHGCGPTGARGIPPCGTHC